jgi:apolipoprotein N-acyltransferase
MPQRTGISQIVGARMSENHGTDSSFLRNGVLIFDTAGVLQGITSKSRLFPFMEYDPFRSGRWRFLKPFFSWIKGGGGYRPADEHNLLPWTVGDEIIAVGAAVCFESMFPDYIGALGHEAAEVLVVVTSDWTLNHTPGLAIHAMSSAFRAAENGRYLIRAGNSGISCIYGPDGKRLVELPPYQTGFAIGEVRPRQHRTLHARFGDWFAWFCVVMLAAELIFGWRAKTDCKDAALS